MAQRLLSPADDAAFHGRIRGVPQNVGVIWRASCLAQRRHLFSPIEEDAEHAIFETPQKARQWIMEQAAARGFSNVEWDCS